MSCDIAIQVIAIVMLLGVPAAMMLIVVMGRMNNRYDEPETIIATPAEEPLGDMVDVRRVIRHYED